MEVPETTLSTALAQHVLGIACFLVGNRLHNNRRQLATRMSHLRPVGCARWRSDVKDLPRGPVGLSSRRHSRKGGRKTRVRCAAKLHTLNTADVTVVTAAKATLPTAAKATATYGSGYLYSDPVLPILPKPAATNRQRALGHHLAVPKWLNCLAESNRQRAIGYHLALAANRRRALGHHRAVASTTAVRAPCVVVTAFLLLSPCPAWCDLRLARVRRTLPGRPCGDPPRV